MSEATEVVGYCRRCQVYVQPFVSGQDCDMDLDSDTVYYHHRYRKRRVRICRECEMLPCFMNAHEWEEHQQWHQNEQAPDR